MKRAAIASITLFALTLAGCTAQTVNDAGISATVKSKLAADSETSAIKIAVDTVNGVVTLSGVVPTEREKSKAELIARNTENVKQVVNNITINPASLGATNVGARAEEAVNDAGSLARIKAKLLTEGITGTNVDVVNGVVTITGEVESTKEITQAIDMIRATDGVKSINNKLTSKRK
jgi:hyperosmotically inducible protein